MFDLEQAIGEWRRQMLAAGVKTPVPLEELESHLREEIERQMKSGLGGAEAFRAAAQKIGPADKLQNEFRKQSNKAWLGTLYPRLVAIYLGCSVVCVVCGIFQMHSRDAFFRTCGKLVIVASLIGATGMCLQAAAVYYSARKRRR